MLLSSAAYAFWVCTIAAARPFASEFGSLEDLVRSARRLDRAAVADHPTVSAQHSNIWDQLSPLPDHDQISDYGAGESLHTVSHTHEPEDHTSTSAEVHPLAHFVPGTPASEDVYFSSLHSQIPETPAYSDFHLENAQLHPQYHQEMVDTQSRPSISELNGGQVQHGWQAHDTASLKDLWSFYNPVEEIRYPGSQMNPHIDGQQIHLASPSTQPEPISTESTEEEEDTQLQTATNIAAEVDNGHVRTPLGIPDKFLVLPDQDVDALASYWMGNDRLRSRSFPDQNDADEFQATAESLWSRGVRRLHKIDHGSRSLLITYHKGAPFAYERSQHTFAVWEIVDLDQPKLAARGLYLLTHTKDLNVPPSQITEYLRESVRLYYPRHEMRPTKYQERLFTEVGKGSQSASDKFFVLPEIYVYAPDKAVEQMVAEFDGRSQFGPWYERSKLVTLTPAQKTHFANRAVKLWARTTKLMRITYRGRIYWLSMHYRTTLLPGKSGVGGMGFFVWEVERQGKEMWCRGIFERYGDNWQTLHLMSDTPAAKYQDNLRVKSKESPNDVIELDD